MDPILNAVFRDIGKDSPAIAYVGAANEDNRSFFERMVGMIQAVGKCTIVQALTYPENADIKKAVKTIQSADAIFVSGGDVEAGMEVLENKGITGIFCEQYEQGKLLFGVSAGSIMLAREWVRWRDPDDDSTAELFPCLGVAPVLCDTHGEADGWEELKAAVALSPDGALGYGITSSTCLKILPTAGPEALGGPIYRYARHGKTVKREADLVP
jgi:cyanophycinase-like exopeptidase